MCVQNKLYLVRKNIDISVNIIRLSLATNKGVLQNAPNNIASIELPHISWDVIREVILIQPNCL